MSAFQRPWVSNRDGGAGEQGVLLSDPAAFGRVAVVYGGRSSEREVSLQSGSAVLEALLASGVDAVGWDPADRPLGELVEAGIDRVWVAMHGPGGEDGRLQGALEWLGIPYTGSGVLASALAMDKLRSKHIFAANGIATPDYAVVTSREDAKLAAERLGYPLIVKPPCEGSSVGISKVLAGGDLASAVDLALEYGATALLERCIVGRELSVTVLKGVALPSVRIETPRAFYDYRAKYESERTEYFCPGTGDAAEEAQYSALALRAFAALGLSGWGRVDFMAGADGEPQVIEANTVPGMTGHSLVPMAAREAGVDFPTLCWRILETSMSGADLARDERGVVNGA